jgi:hypothetical protein
VEEHEDVAPAQQSSPTLHDQSPPSLHDQEGPFYGNVRDRTPARNSGEPQEISIVGTQDDAAQANLDTSSTSALITAITSAPEDMHSLAEPIFESAEPVDGFVEYLRSFLFCSPDLNTNLSELPPTDNFDNIGVFWDQFVAADDNPSLVDGLMLDPNQESLTSAFAVTADQHAAESNAEPDVSTYGAAVYQKSMWNWTPGPEDFGTAEQSNLALPDEVKERSLQTLINPNKRFHSSDRDKILSSLLDGCEQANLVRIVAGFPRPRVLEWFLHIALAHQSEEDVSWIHLPTFEVSGTRTELLIAIIAYGAFLAPGSASRNFACAIPDLLIPQIQRTWHRDNKTSRDPQLLHAWRISAFILAWSGNPRKTEIAEGILHPVINVLRRSGRFDATRYKVIIPDPTDKTEILESKWKVWIEQENVVRLVHQAFMQDAQSSMVHATNPLIAYSEMHLPLPADKMLWSADNALEWLIRSQKLATLYTHNGSVASRIRESMEFDLPSPRQHITSTEILALHGIWGLIFDDQKQAHVMSADCFVGQMHSAMSHQRRLTLSKAIETFKNLRVPDHDVTSPGTWPFVEFLSMALHVPLIHLPCVAGKYGIGQARISLPVVESWAHSESGRRGVWHAGQLLRHARKLPHEASIRAFMVYQAGLVLWVYGVIIQSYRQRLEAAEGKQFGGREPTYVHLDGHWNHGVQRFILMNQGNPAISEFMADGRPISVAAYNASRTIGCAAAIVRGSHGVASSSLFIENLYQLMMGLGEAAKAIGLT